MHICEQVPHNLLAVSAGASKRVIRIADVVEWSRARILYWEKGELARAIACQFPPMSSGTSMSLDVPMLPRRNIRLTAHPMQLRQILTPKLLSHIPIRLGRRLRCFLRLTLQSIEAQRFISA
jgi:hypothetical protein